MCIIGARLYYDFVTDLFLRSAVGKTRVRDYVWRWTGQQIEMCFR